MSSLAVFDFDRTIVQDDSDNTIINKLREKKPPPEWEVTNQDWTPYMSDVFEHAYSAGLHPSDILASISSMRPTPGIQELFKELHQRGWHVLVLTDANTVFVHHWLDTHGLKEMVTAVVTNKAFWNNDRLYIEPCMRQGSCTLCPTNLCKTLALNQFCEGRSYRRLVYCGDGRNDYCPAKHLPSTSTVYPRSGFPLHTLIKNDPASVSARVVPWEDAYTVLRDLFDDAQK
ncbi:unnamed protein product [Danaus chrysippus]|uniref:(African queen) hypothetical protein n=1 Tax=Danaus chrysippus TaxID=151541 RepID=A0A8J2QYS1_9NEOP|nr:unnamed protein product [Danaus chrysippus]